jgi:DNA-binding HxlR family transcriptional regulator
MRSYGQYCAVAKALDVIGDRWALLIVRELLLAGPSRYTDLRRGLPGIATNLLTERLRELEAAGVLVRRDAPPPVASTLYELTERGLGLRAVVHELGLWGAPYMAEGPAAEDAFRSHWMAWPVETFLRDSRPEQGPAALELRAGEDSLVVEASEGVVTTRPGPADDPDAILTGPPHALLGLLSGALPLSRARERGVDLTGDEQVLERLVPRAGATVLPA